VFWQDKRVLITGINGFLGRNLAESLSRQGAQISGFVRNTPRGDKNHSDTSIHFIVGNIDDEESVCSGVSACEPDVIFHLAAQSSVASSFHEPAQTCLTNCLGTSNILEAVRKINTEPVVVFAGSSDEYGLVFSTDEQYTNHIQKFGEPDNPPTQIPEIPISENNPLRPSSPYAVSKVYGDLLMKNYHQTYGIKTVVCRSFNVEGAGRGNQFVTSVIAKQVVDLHKGHVKTIRIGNINPIRDFSHVSDVIEGYRILAERGRPGNTYNLGSMKGVSVASYLLTCLDTAGFPVQRIETLHNGKILSEPLKEDTTPISGFSIKMSELDKKIVQGDFSFSPSDRGIVAYSNGAQINIEFDVKKFRPADIPILIADTRKISQIGYQPRHSIRDIIADQLTFYQNSCS
jgi:GDPmannose 4,6-dehydratase